MKSKSNGKIVDIACDLAVSSIFNGFTSILKVMQVLNFSIDPNSFHFCIRTSAMLDLR